MFLSFTYFQKAPTHSICPRGHEVMLVQSHHVASSITSLFWSNWWRMMHSLTASPFPTLITPHSLLILAKHHAIPCMHIMHQNYQIREMLLLSKLAPHSLSLPSHESCTFPISFQHLKTTPNTPHCQGKTQEPHLNISHPEFVPTWNFNFVQVCWHFYPHLGLI